MELKDLLTLSPRDIDDDNQDEIFEVLNKSNADEVPKRNLRKILEICLLVLNLKGEQVSALQEQVETTQDDGRDESIDDKVIEENEKFKRAVNKLEAERMTHKVKLKEMTDEILSLQKRLHEINAHESDKDSTDPLSELDRYEDLMKNISTKNKHIKRLLNDIEGLQMQNIEQSKTIIELERKLQQAIEESGDVNGQLASSQKQNEELNVIIKRLEEEITRLESNVTYLEDERERAEQELKVFIEKLEERAYAWRNTIDEKENQLESLRKKYEELYLQSPTGAVDYNKESEMKKLVEALHEKDGVIEELENKLRNMAEEMVASTKLMNTISAEREAAKDQTSKKNRNCCAEVQEALLSANSRCKELSEMLETVEEDNLIKSKQAFDAANTLNAYEKGEDGLPQALRKISHLEQKLGSRDKQIKALVMEVNSMHEISQENLILRKKLNIPEDAILSTTNLAAKQRSKDKMIDRLTLKLRASEDMRLELKLEKNELKKRLGELQTKLATADKQESVLKSEEKEEENEAPVIARADVYCDSCLRNIQTLPDKDSVLKDVVKEWEEKYASVIEENENLRVGMHEILEKIREYDASSDHITIDCSILAKLLHALDARSISGWYHPAMRMQNELIAIREREQALREKINLVEKAAQTKDSGTPKKVQIVQELHEITEEEVEIEEDEKSQDEVISADPDTYVVDEPVPPIEGNMLQSEDLYPLIVEKEAENASARTQLLTTTEKYRDLQLKVEKLKCFEVQFQEIVEKMKGGDSEITKYCSTLLERTSEQEIQLKIQEKKYDFMKEDFDRVLTDYKNSESTNIMIIADLKKQINDKKHELSIEKTTDNNKAKIPKHDERDVVDIQKELFLAKAQVAFIVEKLFSGNIPEFCIELENKTEGIMDYGVITDNLQVDYITSDEYDRIKIEQQKVINNCNDMKLKCKQLEELLTIAQDQIKSQQKLISEITDNHIELRHLVADLQSKSEDKFLISKAHRDLETSKREMAKLKEDKEKLEDEHFKLKSRLAEVEKENHKTLKENAEIFKNNDLKLRFLKKSVNILRENYCKFTPLILLADFVSSYSMYMKKSKVEDVSDFLKKIDDITIAKLSASNEEIKSEDLVNLVKYETKCNFLEKQLVDCNKRNEALQAELDQCRLSIVKDSEHWKTIQALFGDNKKSDMQSKSSQTDVEYSDASTNTDIIEKEPEQPQQPIPVAAPRKTLQESPNSSSSASPVKATETKANNITYLENQLEKAMELASSRSALLLETENRLAESKVKIKEMKNIIEAKSEMLREQMDKTSNAEEKAFQRSTGIIESTIASLQSLLTEKDNTLTHYQELLKAEREQYSRACDNYDKELILIKKTNADLEEQLKSKEANILELKSNLETLSKTRKSSKDEVSLEEDLAKLDIGDIVEMSDEKIEEMFMDESRLLKSEILSETPPSQLDESVNRLVLQLQHHLKEAKNREIFWEKSIRAKDEEIALLKEKLTLLQEREKAESLSSPEIEQLRILLEEKDKHISDLMETLTSFHDDQQRFINETSLYSADQVSQLGTDLTRLENSNKILNTQIEALRRQVTSLTQREKQARDLANSLKTQLIKRPVVSIKTELNSRTKMEQLQKRISQLEAELSEARKEIKQQQGVIDAKRAKNASEVSLWEKQKRWQQNAEKLKTRLEETETALQKTRSLLNAAKNTISRLEKDKQTKELKAAKVPVTQCCRVPSCPNLVFTKFRCSDSPDSYSAGSECNSPTKKHYINHYNRAPLDFSECNKEIIGALKARIESQQRKIVALELEGKGSNALVSELERLQEKVTALEAQSIRLEARNLQLQLDNDLVRQGDEVDRLQKRIKHLEDYILALKEELAQAEAQSVRVPSDSKSSNSNPEQTILALKRIIERLRVENRNLKEGRRGSDHRVKEYQDKNQTSEISRLQHLYAESLDKISSLQIELQLKSGCCSMCREKSASSLDGGGDLMNELKIVKDQLVKKTQLLEKAKILLTRAAAKEKNLKEQVAIWKRKCSELQNVPVIDEISE